MANGLKEINRIRTKEILHFLSVIGCNDFSENYCQVPDLLHIRVKFCTASYMKLIGCELHVKTDLLTQASTTISDK